jgi:hypothetical protein
MTPDPLEADRHRLLKDLEDLRRKEAELRRIEELKRREMEELPRKIAERERREREMIRIRAALSATDDVHGRARSLRHAPMRKSGAARRMTRPEERSARIQFLVLCAILAGLLLLLWKSLP